MWKIAAITLISLGALGATAAAHPPPPPPERDVPHRPAVEWSTWVRVGYGVAHDGAATEPAQPRVVTPPVDDDHGAWDAAVGADPLSFSVMTQLPRPLLLDVVPATLGVATAGGYSDRLVEKNAPIPIERTKVFTTARDDQTKVVLDCCRGEQRRYGENEPLGQLVLDGLPSGRRGEVKIEVTFRVDTDGILHVRARDAATGADQEVAMTILGAPTPPPTTSPLDADAGLADLLEIDGEPT